MENKLKVGDVVYMTTYRNPLKAEKATVVSCYGLDEFDEDERELYKVVSDEDKKVFMYHYPSLENDYFYIYTRSEYINLLKGIKKANNNELQRQIKINQQNNKKVDDVISSVEIECTSSNGHDFTNWRRDVRLNKEESNYVALTRRCRICGNIQKTMVLKEEYESKKTK